MSHEIEAKIKVSELEPINTALQSLGAEFVHTVTQMDTYFMDMHKLLHKNDCGLRIRKQVTGNEKTALITFKGAREKGKYKSRPEYETAIDNPETMGDILEALGYHKRLTVEKQRSLWRLDGCDVCLDTLPELGCFVEVEGSSEDVIENVLTKLNLQDQPHISHGYASMTKQKLKSDSRVQTDPSL